MQICDGLIISYSMIIANTCSMSKQSSIIHVSLLLRRYIRMCNRQLCCSRPQTLSTRAPHASRGRISTWPSDESETESTNYAVESCCQLLNRLTYVNLFFEGCISINCSVGSPHASRCRFSKWPWDGSETEFMKSYEEIYFQLFNI